MEVYQKEIPATSAEQYVSGRYALNIPGETSGDWHFTGVWFSAAPATVDLWGKGQKYDTVSIFGKFGIADRKADVKKTGLKSDYPKVYIADHYRAILDLAIAGAISGNMSLVKGATTDYLDTKEQKEYVLAEAEKALASDRLTKSQKILLNDWIKKESQNIYRGEADDV